MLLGVGRQDVRSLDASTNCYKNVDFMRKPSDHASRALLMVPQRLSSRRLSSLRAPAGPLTVPHNFLLLEHVFARLFILSRVFGPASESYYITVLTLN